MVSISILTVALASAVLAQENKSNIVSIPYENTYILPPQYQCNGSADFIQTTTSNSTLNALFAQAQGAPFISYTPEFTSLLGSNPQPQLIAERNDTPQFYESGVWVPQKNEVWFTSSISAGYTYLYILNLETLDIRQPKLSQEIVNPNGGYYFNGKVYQTSLGNATYEGGVYAIDIEAKDGMYDTEIVVNSYFGARFNGLDDVTWGSFSTATSSSQSSSSNCNTTSSSAQKMQGTKKGVMFFTDINFRFFVPGYTAPPFLPDAVWRFDPSIPILTPIIPRSDILLPNGIRVNADSSILYVTDTTPTVESQLAMGGGFNSTGSPAIYAYPLTSDGWLQGTRRMVGIARRGVADGIHIDDQGRIWTGESEGVVVRSKEGKVLGVFSAKFFLKGGGEGEGVGAVKIANFALAGDRLVVLAVERLWIVKLGEAVVGRERFEL